MRSRTILSAVLGAVIAGLVAVIVFLGGCAGPGANAETTGPAPEIPMPTKAAPHPGSVVVRSGGSGGGSVAGHPGPRHSTTAIKPPTKPHIRRSAPPPHDPPAEPVPARLGTASVPAGATYNPSSDGQAFTTAFSTLEARTGKALSTRLSTTVKVTGDTRDAVLELSVTGYALTDAATTAKVGVTANGRTVNRVFQHGSDEDILQTVSVPLRGAHECTITLTVELQPDPAVRADGYIDILALDGQFI